MGPRASHWYVPSGSDFTLFHYLPPACMDFLFPSPSSHSMFHSLNILPIKVFKRNQLKGCDVESTLNCYIEWNIYTWCSEFLEIDCFCCSDTFYVYNVKLHEKTQRVTWNYDISQDIVAMQQCLVATLQCWCVTISPTIYDQLFVLPDIWDEETHSPLQVTFDISNKDLFCRTVSTLCNMWMTI